MSYRGLALSAAAVLSLTLSACMGASASNQPTVTVTVTRQVGAPATAAKPSATSTGTKAPGAKALDLGAGSFGGVKLPATPAALLAAVKPTLGDPKKVDGKGCELAGTGRTSVLLTWGDVSAYGEAGPGEALRITSWAVKGKTTPVPVTLPFGTTLGMKRAALAKTLTGETVDTTRTFAEGDILVQDKVWWSLDKANTTVVSVNYNPQVCE